MDVLSFWYVIGEYNSHSQNFQIILLLFLSIGLILSYKQKIKWAAKLVIGVANLYIGIAFLGLFGTEPIQKNFALQLYLCCGLLFYFNVSKIKMIYWKNKTSGKAFYYCCLLCIL